MSAGVACEPLPNAPAPPDNTVPSFEVIECPTAEVTSSFRVGDIVELQAAGDQTPVDPENGRYLWTLVKKPDGAADDVLDTAGTSRRTLLHTAVAGRYRACFTSEDAGHACCTMNAVDRFHADVMHASDVQDETDAISVGTTTSADDIRVTQQAELWLEINEPVDVVAMSIEVPDGVTPFGDVNTQGWQGGAGIHEFFVSVDDTPEHAGRALRDGDTITWHIDVTTQLTGETTTIDEPITLAPRAVAVGSARITAAHVQFDTAGNAALVIDDGVDLDRIWFIDVGGPGLNWQDVYEDGGLDGSTPNAGTMWLAPPHGAHLGVRPWFIVGASATTAGPDFFFDVP